MPQGQFGGQRALPDRRTILSHPTLFSNTQSVQFRPSTIGMQPRGNVGTRKSLRAGDSGDTSVLRAIRKKRLADTETGYDNAGSANPVTATNLSASFLPKCRAFTDFEMFAMKPSQRMISTMRVSGKSKAAFRLLLIAMTVLATFIWRGATAMILPIRLN